MRVRSFFSVKKAEKGGKMRSRKAQTAKESDTDVKFHLDVGLIARWYTCLGKDAYSNSSLSFAP